jgi:hypothetical protein
VTSSIPIAVVITGFEPGGTGRQMIGRFNDIYLSELVRHGAVPAGHSPLAVS